MKRMYRVFGAMALALVAGVTNVSAEQMYDWSSSGSYAVGKEASITIGEEGEKYLKLSGFTAGNPYTFIANGAGAGIEIIFTYSEDGDLWDSWLATSSPDFKTEDQERCIVTFDDWVSANIVKDPEYEYDPGEWNEWKVSPRGYFLHVIGEGGATIRVSSMNGASEEQIPLGDMDNPKEIKPGSVPTTYSSSYVDGAYYFYTAVNDGAKYLFATTGGTEELPIALDFVEGSDADYLIEDVSEKVSTAGNAAYLLTVTRGGILSYYTRGPGTTFGLVSQTATSGTLGSVTVRTKGAEGTWSIKGAKGSYASGETVVILGAQTIVFSRKTGFSTPADQVAVPTDDEPNVEIIGEYNDTFDPKDDVVSGATKLSPTAKGVTAARTLFTKDQFDHFSFTARDGVYYNFALEDLEGDAEMVIFKKGDATETPLAEPGTKILSFAPGKGDFIVRVFHANTEEDVDAQYTLAASSANVGAISFAKTAVTAKKSAGTVSLTVNRSQSEGKVRVRYGTVNDTAKPGVDYMAQTGELVWEDGDKKAKTITIKLIPEAFAEEALSRRFSVELKALEPDEIDEEGEYLAAITAGKGIATVTVTEAKGKPEKEVKAATTKTEVVPLETGTYQGVIVEDGFALTNGFPQIASVTFSAKNATKKALSAKVMIAGKTYAFAADTWTTVDGGVAVAELVHKQKINKIDYENKLEVTVKTGVTAESDDWKEASASVVLTMNVPDANSKGVQEEIVYSGELFRDNSKIQDYLYAVTNAVGYYTVALVPSGVSNYDGIPAGNGYLTLTIDNKGKAKIAGQLADGTTKPSYSSIVAVRDDGETLYVPVFVAKSPSCFGGTLKLVRGEDGKYIVDSSEYLIWNNDNAALTYDGEEGWQIEVEPVGGYFNTVNNLQSYYLTSAFAVSTVSIDELPTEALTEGYEYVTSVQPTEKEVSLAGNAFLAEKQVLKKDGTRVILEESTNPCNVQAKLTRATGLVTGTFSLWSENGEDGKQKELKNIKHNGILLLSRDTLASLDPEVMTAGYFTQALTLKYTVTDARGKESNKTRKYTSSMPFNILAIDQGEPDWYADDWGEFED